MSVTEVAVRILQALRSIIIGTAREIAATLIRVRSFVDCPCRDGVLHPTADVSILGAHSGGTIVLCANPSSN